MCITHILKLILKTKKKIFCIYKKWLIANKHIFIILLYTYIKIVNRYYRKNKEKLQREACERYLNLSEKEKEKRQKNTRHRYTNLSEEAKEKERRYHRDQNKNLSKDFLKSL